MLENLRINTTEIERCLYEQRLATFLVSLLHVFPCIYMICSQLNEERLDYEIHVLRKHEEEVVLVKSEQKRKITNLQVTSSFASKVNE